MRIVRPRKLRTRRGMTLLEMGIAICIMGILLALVVPSFNRAIEQNRLDSATQYLRSIWSAERVYWLENRTFAGTLVELDALKLLDSRIIAGSDGYYSYTITDADADGFIVTATRNGSNVWSGAITITHEGNVAGQVTGPATLTPPEL